MRHIAAYTATCGGSFAPHWPLMIGWSCMMLPHGALAADAGVTNAKVVLRKEADKESSALQTVPEGEEVDILGKSGDWYKVRYGNFTGYMMKKYVTQSPSTAVAAAASIKALAARRASCASGMKTATSKSSSRR